MKITIYELLGMIKDGNAPKEIKYEGCLLSWDNVDKDYYCEEYGSLFEYLFSEFPTTNILNFTIEILEEEKKIPEKLDVIAYEKCIHEVTHKEKQLALEIRETQIAFNEIIDYLKSKGDE